MAFDRQRELFAQLGAARKAEIAFPGVWARKAPEKFFAASLLGALPLLGLGGGRAMPESLAAAILAYALPAAMAFLLAFGFHDLARWILERYSWAAGKEPERLSRLDGFRHWALAAAGLALGPGLALWIALAPESAPLSDARRSLALFILWVPGLALWEALWIASSAACRLLSPDPESGRPEALLAKIARLARERWRGLCDEILRAGMGSASAEEWERRAVASGAKKTSASGPGPQRL